MKFGQARLYTRGAADRIKLFCVAESCGNNPLENSRRVPHTSVLRVGPYIASWRAGRVLHAPVLRVGGLSQGTEARVRGAHSGTHIRIKSTFPHFSQALELST